MYTSYTLYTLPHPTIEQLKARRAECLMFALAMQRRITSAHPDANTIDWEHARDYWKQQAFHAHGEIMTRLDPSSFY